MAHPMNETLYDILEVSATASCEEIEKSYKRIVNYLERNSLAMYSLFDEEELTRLRSSVDQAYRTLSDPSRRAAYDRAIAEGEAAAYPALMLPQAFSDSDLSIGMVQQEEVVSDEQECAKSYEDTPEKATTHSRVEADRSETTSAATGATFSRPRERRATRLEPSLDIQLTEDTEFSGALLRRLRESAHASYEDVADITKINKRYLRAIEENDFANLPAAVYVRGFVSEYARALGLDPKMVAKSYMCLYERYKGQGG